MSNFLKKVGHYLLHNAFRILGFIMVWLVPLILILSDFKKVDVSKWSGEMWSLPLLFVVILIYWKKLRKYLHEKLLGEEISDKVVSRVTDALSVKAPKNYAKPLWVFINGVMVELTIVLGYLLCRVLQTLSFGVADFLKIVVVTCGVGEFFYLVDAVLKIGGKKNEEQA